MRKIELIFGATVVGKLRFGKFFDLVKMIRAEKSEYVKLMIKTNKIDLEELPYTPDIGKMALAFNKPEIQQIEMPSGNCHGSARGMAKLASIMANYGKCDKSDEKDDEKFLMSNETWEKMHDNEKLSVDANMFGNSKYQ